MRESKAAILSQPARESLASMPPAPISELPWGHNRLLLTKLYEPAIRLWYARKVVEHGWSRAVLAHHIEAQLYKREGKAVTNFKRTLPPSQSDLAEQTLKDPYNFDFLTLGSDARERDLEQGLLDHIQKFLLELGVGFAFVGRQYRSRLRAAMDVERVTKKFYDLFQKEHAAFLKSFANCIPVKADAEWYASVMLNRLMFVYFIQHKGFLDGDHDYLRTRLSLVRKQQGKDKFHSFYRYFLIKLFHEGLGGKKRTPELEKLIGKIPYLNGGMFDVHELEKPECYGNVIQIPDEAFERIFDYFDKYDWVLDPQRSVKQAGDREEINPDVLGYIFEKYINQKQMGAYYTKEDSAALGVLAFAALRWGVPAWAGSDKPRPIPRLNHNPN